MIKPFGFQPRILLFFALLGFAVTSHGMNNQDVIKMVQADLSEDTIIAAIHAADTDAFDTSADGLIQLKEKQVGERIIQAMIKRGKSASETVSRLEFKNVPDELILPPMITPEVGRTYYTRYSFKHEEGESPATNYWRGTLVPINTQVTLKRIQGNKISLELADSKLTVDIINVPKYTQRSSAQVAAELLAEKPTAIEKYGDDMAEIIRGGTLRLGMTKTQVILTRGYPPRHETPSTQGDIWKYWSSRFVVHTLVFKDGILSEGRGLY